MNINQKEQFFFQKCDDNTFSFSYSVWDEKVKKCSAVDPEMQAKAHC